MDLRGLLCDLSLREDFKLGWVQVDIYRYIDTVIKKVDMIGGHWEGFKNCFG